MSKGLVSRNALHQLPGEPDRIRGQGGYPGTPLTVRRGDVVLISADDESTSIYNVTLDSYGLVGT